MGDGVGDAVLVYCVFFFPSLQRVRERKKKDHVVSESTVAELRLLTKV